MRTKERIEEDQMEWKRPTEDRKSDASGNPLWRMNISIEQPLREMIDDMRATGGSRTNVIRRAIRILYRVEQWKSQGGILILKKNDTETVLEIL